MNTTTQSNEKTAPAVDLPVDLRDYFAAKAMEGLIASDADSTRVSDRAHCRRHQIADAAYAMADVMLIKRKNQ